MNIKGSPFLKKTKTNTRAKKQSENTMFRLYLKSLTYRLPNSKKQFIEDLNENLYKTESLPLLNTRNPLTYKVFEGHTTPTSFQFRRILKEGANSFIPIASGDFLETENMRPTLVVDFQLHRSVRVFISMFTIFAFVLWILNWMSGNLFSSISLIALALMILPHLISYILFQMECRKAMAFIERLINKGK